MQKVEFLVYTGIVLDHCRSCGGFWLDGKELERINEFVHDLNESSEELGSPAMQWFAQFLFSLPR
jgi:Zn-finger nucleic acid-binding protein